MGWNRDSLPTKVLSFFLSVVLAVGLVPLPALAEAVDEMVSATTDPIATEEPATTEEPAAEPTTTEEPTSTEPAAEPTAAEPVAEPVATEDPAADMPAFEGEQVVDGVRVSVAAEAGTFPAGARLRVSKATQAQERQAGEAVGEVRDEGVTVAESHTFDVEVLDANDTPVQPTEGHKVEVSFTQAEVADKNLQTQVYHVTEDAATGELAAQNLEATTQPTPETGDSTTVVVQTDGFSLYTVEFTYNKKQYVMPGDTQVPLSTVLAAVGLTGEVSAAKVSNSQLFSASNETGEWVVTVHQAFGTTEWLKVTINDVTYQIAVTDSETQTVSYVERHWDEVQKKVVAESKTREAKLFPTNSTTIPGGWYVAEGSIQVNSRVSITGDTHLSTVMQVFG